MVDVAGVVLSVCLETYDRVSERLHAAKENRQQCKLLNERLSSVRNRILAWRGKEGQLGPQEVNGLNSLTSLLTKIEQQVSQFTGQHKLRQFWHTDGPRRLFDGFHVCLNESISLLNLDLQQDTKAQLQAMTEDVAAWRAEATQHQQQLKEDWLQVTAQITASIQQGAFYSSLQAQPTADKVIVQIPESQVQRGRFLGVGRLGPVNAGDWLGAQVVIKDMDLRDAELPSNDKRGLYNEGWHLARCRHPNIVQLYGVIVDDCQENVQLVMELLPGESLLRKLEKCRPQHETTQTHTSGPFALVDAVEILRQVAVAVNYLHKNPEPIRPGHPRGIVHRAIYPGNIFVSTTAEKQVKLKGFGFAKFKTQTSARMHSRCVGPKAYQAPEMQGGDYDDKVDIFSFAVTAYEVITGVEPLANTCLEQFGPDESYRPPIPSWVPSDLQKLLLQSWDADPNCRPSALQVKDRL